MTTSTGPLAGVKVLELGTLIAGPFAARLLGEFGADVIKIEDPNGGDPLRKWRKLYAEVDGTSLWWDVQARNKKSVTRQSEGRRGQGDRAAAREGSRHRRRELPARRCSRSWGSATTCCRRENPGLVMVRISGYGQTGPYRDRPGFGAIARIDGRLAPHHRLSRPAAAARRHFDRRLARGAARRDRRADGAASQAGERRHAARWSTSRCTKPSST